jgi:putative (di)nucleoside polyphosphate hydrolase
MKCRITSSASDARGHYRGQKQIWFLLQFMGRDCDMNLRATTTRSSTPGAGTSTGCRWTCVIEFKREVYQLALTELSRFLPRAHPHNRFLRSGMRAQRREELEAEAEHGGLADAAGEVCRSLDETALPAEPAAVPLTETRPDPV